MATAAVLGRGSMRRCATALKSTTLHSQARASYPSQ